MQKKILFYEKKNQIKLALILLVVLLHSCNQQEKSKVIVKSDKITLEEIESMPLIESHCHIDWGIKNTPLAMNNLIELQKKENLTYALWISKDFNSLIEAAQENKTIAGALLRIFPDTTNWEALELLIKQNIDVVKGIKLHPTSDKFDVEYRRLEPVFRLANKYNILVVTHTDTIRSHASKFRPLMDAFPDTKLILYHVAPQDEACQMVNDFKNVYLDVSYTAWGKEFQQEVLSKVNKEKILFGIDSPLGFPFKNSVVMPHYRDAAKEIAAFYNFDRDVVEHIFYKNSIKLLGLEN